MDDRQSTVTAIILTLNEAEHIVDCIDSLAWAEQIIVLDSYSEDETVQLAEGAGATIHQNRFENYAQQRNVALDLVETDWVLFVDADERGMPALEVEIRELIAQSQANGFYIPRHNYIFGKLTQGAGWYPDYQLRLFRRGKVRYERPVHETAVVDGEIGYLTQPLIHFNYRDVAHFHAKQRKYTVVDAGILYQQGVCPKFYTPFIQPIRHFLLAFCYVGRLQRWLAWVAVKCVYGVLRMGKDEIGGGEMPAFYKNLK